MVLSRGIQQINTKNEKNVVTMATCMDTTLFDFTIIEYPLKSDILNAIHLQVM